MFLIFLLSSALVDVTSFSLAAASLFIFLDSTSMALLSASTFLMSICKIIFSLRGGVTEGKRWLMIFHLDFIILSNQNIVLHLRGLP